MAFNDIYSSRRVLKWGLVIVSALLVGYFLYFSNNLVKDLSEQERNRMQIWADATKELVSMSVATESSPANVNFLLSIIEANDNIPVLLVDENDNILDHRNFQLPDANDSVSYYGMLSEVNKAFLDDKLRGLKHSSNRIDIQIDEDITHNLYYEDSTLLRRLQFYPYVLLGVLVVFVLVVYFALMSIKKAEQNKVWV